MQNVIITKPESSPQERETQQTQPSGVSVVVNMQYTEPGTHVIEALFTKSYSHTSHNLKQIL